ncbi:MAG: 30S ribosomal protein S9 [Ilumatobacteraceae bacterium]
MHQGATVANAPLTQTTGRRKEAVARAVVRAGSGKVTVNGRPIEAYFTTATQRMTVTEPLRVAGREETFDVDANIFGGGVTGQAGALRMAIARSLVEIDPESRPALKKAGLLTRDARKKESKKYGLKKARKAPQFTKR